MSHPGSHESNFCLSCYRIGYAVPGFCTAVLVIVVGFQGQLLSVLSWDMLTKHA